MNKEDDMILVATYPFKGTYTSAEAGEAIARVLGMEVEVLALGDGGAGTLDALVDRDAAMYRTTGVSRSVDGTGRGVWGVRSDGVGVIEAARLVGLAALPPGGRDPLGISTYGIGELVLAAAGEGCREIWIGLGDTATHDLGLGMAAALGYRFLTCNGTELDAVGRSLPRLGSIDASNVDPVVTTLAVTGLCDVLNPLLGPDGSAQRFLHQKGGSQREIEEMEVAAARFVEIVRRDLGIDRQDRPGAGAAGGLGAGIVAFLNGNLVGGAACVLDAVDIDTRIARSSLVITGEGRVDRGTLLGKGTAGVVARAAAAGVPAVIVTGSVDGDREEFSRRLGASILEIGTGTGKENGEIESVGERLRELVGNVAGGTR